MKINDIDFLNSFRGCLVIDSRMTKRFKGRVEGKNRYANVFIIYEIFCLIYIVTLFVNMIRAFTAGEPSNSLTFELLFSIVLVFLLKLFYEKWMYETMEYTLLLGEAFSQEDREKIEQKFYLKPTNYLDKSKNADNHFVAYPKEGNTEKF